MLNKLQKRKGSNKELISWLIILFLIGPFLVYAVPEIIGAEDALIVQSGSMEPEIPTGSVIVIYDVDISELEKEDIITFGSGNSPVDGERELTTHRIIDVQSTQNGYQFRTKGDNNEDPDPTTVSGEQVVGQHAFTVPYMGYLLVELRSLNAFFLLVIIPAILLILSEFKQIRSEASHLKQKGKEREIIETASVTTAIFFSAIIAGFYTGIIPDFIQQNGFQFSLGPTVLGVVMMGSILLSMIILKII